MTTSGHFADTHGPYMFFEPNLIHSQFAVAWADTQKLFWSANRLWTDIVNLFPGEVHETPQRIHTLTIIGMYWQSDMFTDRSKADKF